MIQATDIATKADLLRACNEWLRAVWEYQAAKNRMDHLAEVIRLATDTEEGGTLDVCWPLIVGNIAIDLAEGGKGLVLRTCERLGWLTEDRP